MLGPMAQQYRVTPVIRLVNTVATWMARRGKGPSVVMTTTGRKTGRPRSVPVSPITHDGVEYVVSPYGEVAWVGNVRTHPAVTLQRGKRTRSVRLVEVTGEAPQVVEAYHRRESFARRYMDVPADATAADFATNAAKFPLFRVEPA